MQDIQNLINSNIRKHKGKELPSPGQVIDLFQTYGEIKMVKYSGKTEGLDDSLHDVELINNYLLEVKVEDLDEAYGTLGIIVQQGSNKMKIYSGLTAHACLNLSVFNADYIKSLKTVDLSVMRHLLEEGYKNLSPQIKLITEQIERLKQREYSEEEWITKKGNLLSTMPVGLLKYLVHAEEELRNKEGLYYDQPLTDWNLLSAMTDKIKNDSINARLTDTLKLEQLFN